jgi:hypothetical protein
VTQEAKHFPGKHEAFEFKPHYRKRKQQKLNEKKTHKWITTDYLPLKFKTDVKQLWPLNGAVP